MRIKLSGIRKNSSFYEDFEIEIDRLDDILIEKENGKFQSFDDIEEDLRYEIEFELEKEYDYPSQEDLDDLEDENYKLYRKINKLELKIKELEK